MRKFLHFLLALAGLALAVILGWLFTIIYRAVGDALLAHDNQTVTLFKVLTQIDYRMVGTAFLMILIYMLLLDLLVVVGLRSWRKSRAQKPVKQTEQGRSKLARFWFDYRTIHIVFILLTLFGTLAITAPAMVMNSFTAIVSISVLVSNLTKKIGKDD